jgi:hypothetical protein
MKLSKKVYRGIYSMQTPEQNNRLITYFVRAALVCVRRGMTVGDTASLKRDEEVDKKHKLRTIAMRRVLWPLGAHIYALSTLK